MSKNNQAGSSLDWIFKVPKKLTFSGLYRYYFNFILRLLYRIFIIENNVDTVDETFLKMILFLILQLWMYRLYSIGYLRKLKKRMKDL